jgi:hypothetical protein
MAANVLRSPKAVRMSAYVARAFITQRKALAVNADTLKRFAEIDRTLIEHDSLPQVLWRQLHPLLAPPVQKPGRKIGSPTGRR